jgi:hypothetical protein
MIEPKNAVENAAKYYREVSSDNSALQLEEIELSGDKTKWLVTLSHPGPNPSLAVLMGNGDNRIYKAFSIDAETGNVESMKVKKIS